MSESFIYLDNNATTPLLPEVVDAMSTVMVLPYGNPSSPHSIGEGTRDIIETARGQVSNLINGNPDNLIFTSGGSEANNQAILSGLGVSGLRRIVTSSVEHSSIKKLCENLEGKGISVEFLPVDSSGLINLNYLEEKLKLHKAFVSIQWVNNETGVIQPISEIAAICKKYHCLFHTDAAQALGKLEIDISSLDPDYLTITAHKINGPQGVGALYAKDIEKLTAIVVSGTEEFGKRGGTENLLGIVGFGKACEIRKRDYNECIDKMGKYRDAFEGFILTALPELKTNGSRTQRVCNTTNIQFPGVDGRAMMSQLDNNDVICSQTSACVSQIPEPSFVLMAMGLDAEDAFSSLRFSFSSLNTIDEAKDAAEKVIEVYNKVKSLFRY
ncbi:MAG: cysteine desulfurase family protein [Spirochaetia bacterium]|jgi:cysteine desulfurase|nr:cysteine desulfurase family protein [Spirochaetia bacterium]